MICQTVWSDARGLMPIIAVPSMPSRITSKSPPSELAFAKVPVVRSGAPVSSLPVPSRPWQRPHCARNRRSPIRTSTEVVNGFSWAAAGAVNPPPMTSPASHTACTRPIASALRMVHPLRESMNVLGAIRRSVGNPGVTDES